MGIYDNIEEVSIYTNGHCNFDCSYCDRSSVAKVGYQQMRKQDIPAIIDYIVDLEEKIGRPLKFISFHGGEPLLSVRFINDLLVQLQNRVGRLPTIYLQTNGSLIRENQKFFHTFKDNLYVSISYDFKYQKINRTGYSINDTLRFLNRIKVKVQLQHVIPTNESSVLKYDHLNSILSLHHRYRIHRYNFIILRHIRGSEGTFRPVLNGINLSKYTNQLMGFFGVLYAHGCSIMLDGVHETEINKAYFDSPPYVVLSPDGNIYTEYDFLEYRINNSVVGNWRDKNIIPITQLEDSKDKLVFESCLECLSFDYCGLKFLHKETNTPIDFPEQCRDFYQYTRVILNYINKLKAKPSLIHHFMEE